MRDSGKRIGCYACSNFGYVAEARTMTGAASLNPGSNGRLYRASDRSIKYGCVSR